MWAAFSICAAFTVYLNEDEACLFCLPSFVDVLYGEHVFDRTPCGRDGVPITADSGHREDGRNFEAKF